MRGGRYFPIVGNLAHVPQPRDCGSAVGERAHFFVAGRVLENHNILGDWRPSEARMRGQHRERSRKRTERGKIEFRVAPLQHLYGFETVAFKRMNEFSIERRTAPGGAEAAIAGGTAGAAGDLGKFSRTEATELIAVELAVRRKCHVTDVKIETHADCIRGDEIIDVAGLVEFDLGIAGARRKCT